LQACGAGVAGLRRWRFGTVGLTTPTEKSFLLLFFKKEVLP